MIRHSPAAGRRGRTSWIPFRYDRSVGNGALVVPIISGGQFDSTCTVTVPYSYTLDSATSVPASTQANSGVGKTGQ